MEKDKEAPSVRFVGVIRSPFASRAETPKQETEGGAEVVLEIFPEFRDALDGLSPGREIVVLTWLHLSGREALRVHPRGNASAPLRGVFATRSPDRPNPIGLHQAKILAISEDGRLTIAPMDVLDETPVVDIKPALRPEK